MSSKVNLTDEQAQTIIRQIGFANLAAISGGRRKVVDGTLVLPAGAGYSVEIDLDAGWDLYTVRRVFSRAGKRFVKGEVSMVDAYSVGEVAYEASSFRSYDFPRS